MSDGDSRIPGAADLWRYTRVPFEAFKTLVGVVTHNIVFALNTSTKRTRPSRVGFIWKIQWPFRCNGFYECCNPARRRTFHGDLNRAVAILFRERKDGNGVTRMLLLAKASGPERYDTWAL